MSLPPMIRASHLKVVASAMFDLGIDCTPILRNYKLPTEFSNDAFAMVSFFDSVNFFEEASLETRLTNLGMQVGRMHGFADVGPIGDQLKNSFTVYSAISKLIANARCHGSIVSYALARAREGSWLRSDSYSSMNERFDATEQYTLMIMISIVRMGINQENWSPSKIRLRTYPKSPTAIIVQDEFPKANIEFSNRSTQIQIDDAALSRELRMREWKIEAAGHHLYPIDTQNLKLILPDLIRSYLSDGHVTIESMAEVLDLSKRTIQRRLQEQGLEFSTLVTETRMKLAMDTMYLEPEISITDLAAKLGFIHPNSLTRAFGNWTGISPSEYRKIVKLRQIQDQ